MTTIPRRNFNGSRDSSRGLTTIRMIRTRDRDDMLNLAKLALPCIPTKELRLQSEADEVAPSARTGSDVIRSTKIQMF